MRKFLLTMHAQMGETKDGLSGHFFDFLEITVFNLFQKAHSKVISEIDVL